MEEETKLHKQRIDALSNEQQRAREELASVSSIMQNLKAGFESTQQKMKALEGRNDFSKSFPLVNLWPYLFEFYSEKSL